MTAVRAAAGHHSRHRLFLLSAAGKSGRTVPIGAALTDDGDGAL